jgi:protein TonB
VRPNGAVWGCAIVSEEPPDYGFGKAAIGLSTLFRTKPGGTPANPETCGRLTIPINFKPPQ